MTRVPSTSIGATPRRRLATALIAVLALLAVTLPQTAASARGADPAAQTSVDPGLLAAIQTGVAVPAILSWDDEAATRGEVLAHLRDSGLRFSAFSHLDMAVVCAGSQRDVNLLAATPGGISVFGDEDLTTTLDADIVTAQAASATTSSPAAAAAAADLGVTGAGVGIVVLDTGVDGRHPDLAYGSKTVLNTRVVISHYEILGVGEDTCAPDTFMEDQEDSETTSGHGTHLAGVAAGDGTASNGSIRGMAPDADVVGLSVLEQVTPEHHGDVKLSLIRFIAAVNHTLSTTLVDGPTTAKVAIIGWSRDGLYDPFHPHFLAIRDLWDFGIVPVLAVGNAEAGDADCSRAETCTFNPLAVGRDLIAVGASTPDNADLAEYSAWGDRDLRDARGKLVAYEPLLVAPGRATAALRIGMAPAGTPDGLSPYSTGASGGIPTSANTAYQTLEGTSVSAAYVAGAIALMQEAAAKASGCYLRPFQVRDILRATAQPLAGYERHQVGSGAIDVAAAVTAAGDQEFYGGPNPWDCAG